MSFKFLLFYLGYNTLHDTRGKIMNKKILTKNISLTLQTTILNIISILSLVIDIKIPSRLIKRPI